MQWMEVVGCQPNAKRFTQRFLQMDCMQTAPFNGYDPAPLEMSQQLQYRWSNAEFFIMDCTWTSLCCSLSEPCLKATSPDFLFTNS